MSASHKAALAKGRAEGIAVRNYLGALDVNRPRRGRKRTPETIGKQLETPEKELIDANPLVRLHLMQRKQDLLSALSSVGSDLNVEALEAQFVSVAKAYGDRKGISYGTWRTAGVSAATLQKAGIARTREHSQAA